MVLTDTATFSSRPSPGASRQIRCGLPPRHRDGWARTPTLQRTDLRCTPVRQLLGRVFTPRRVAEMSEHIDDVVHSLIDEFADRGECEFVSEFAIPLPGIIIAEQLGLDRSEIMTFRRWADAMLAMAQRALTEEEAVATAEVEVEAQHFLAHEFEARRAEPRDDLISALVHAHGDDEEPLTMGELQDLMHQLVTGGFETTTAALGTGLWLLCGTPSSLPAPRGPGAHEELHRGDVALDSPVAGLWRMTTCPARIGDTEIPEGAAMPRPPPRIAMQRCSPSPAASTSPVRTRRATSPSGWGATTASVPLAAP
jgi:cytochrome P450